MILDRKCIKCDTEFQLKPTDKASNICIACKNAYQKKYANKKSRVSVDGYKDTYPYREREKINLFKEIRNKLDKMKQREEWQAFFKEQLYKLETDDILVLKWIYDRRSHDTVQETIEQPHKKESYNDTRTTHNNTKSWFD
jgi:hypothetical protein